MSKHTQEPWRIDEYMGVIKIKKSDSTIITICTMPEVYSEIEPQNAERIVQCVNAMAGIDDPEAFVKEVTRIFRKIDKSNEYDLVVGLMKMEVRETLLLFPEESETK